MEYNERSFEKSAPQRDDIPAKSGIAPAGSPPRPSISGGCDMKSLILLVLLSALAVSCSGSDPTAPVNSDTTRLSMFDTGRVVVYVYWADQGIPGKKVEVLELGKIKFTDENGTAGFSRAGRDIHRSRVRSRTWRTGTAVCRHQGNGHGRWAGARRRVRLSALRLKCRMIATLNDVLL
jgi:hypothetical protein